MPDGNVMARRLGSHSKSQRVLEFLQGLSHPEIAARMQQCGFREEDRRRAWELLAAYCNQRYVAHLPRANTGQLVRDADAFENRYFPIAQATLEANFPAIAALVFRNLRRTNDRRVLIELAVFLERIRQLDRAPKRSERGRARALLSDRGLTDEVIARGEQLVELTGRQTKEEEDRMRAFGDETADALHAQVLVAEDALWGWYLEWSRIARTVIGERSLLRLLGFGRAGRPRKNDDADAGLDIDPATQPGGAFDPRQKALNSGIDATT